MTVGKKRPTKFLEDCFWVKARKDCRIGERVNHNFSNLLSSETAYLMAKQNLPEKVLF
jgi:hypothetical protein